MDINLLEQNLDKINWHLLSCNPNAIHLLEQNIDKIDWNCLSQNENAIHLLKQYKNKIDWQTLLYNPSIFKYNYHKMKENMNEMQEEIYNIVIHPDNLEHITKKYKIPFNELLQIYS